MEYSEVPSSVWLSYKIEIIASGKGVKTAKVCSNEFFLCELCAFARHTN
jgi:hypothetical protein